MTAPRNTTPHRLAMSSITFRNLVLSQQNIFLLVFRISTTRRPICWSHNASYTF
jgi:hypothetical protein